MSEFGFPTIELGMNCYAEPFIPKTKIGGYLVIPDDTLIRCSFNFKGEQCLNKCLLGKKYCYIHIKLGLVECSAKCGKPCMYHFREGRNMSHCCFGCRLGQGHDKYCGQRCSCGRTRKSNSIKCCNLCDGSISYYGKHHIKCDEINNRIPS